MSLPYITEGAIAAAAKKVPDCDYPPIDTTEAAREILEAAGPQIAQAVLEMFASVFDKAAGQAKLHPAIHNNVRVMIESYAKEVGAFDG